MFKDRLREARKTAHFTQERLAEQVGVKKSTIAGYESGHSEPDMEKLIKIMKILNVDANYLCQDEMQNKSSSVSDRAMEVAKAYDSMSPYGKSMIDKVVENEKKYRVARAVPLVGELINDGTVEAKRAAKQEQRELEREENVLNSEKI